MLAYTCNNVTTGVTAVILAVHHDAISIVSEIFGSLGDEQADILLNIMFGD